MAADSPESLGGWNIIQGVLDERVSIPKTPSEKCSTPIQSIWASRLWSRTARSMPGFSKPANSRASWSSTTFPPTPFGFSTNIRRRARLPAFESPLSLAASAKSEPTIVKAVARALLEMPTSPDGYAWEISAKTVLTAFLYRELRIGPCRHLRDFRWDTLRVNYKPWFIGLAAALLFAAFHILRTARLNAFAPDSCASPFRKRTVSTETRSAASCKRM